MVVLREASPVGKTNPYLYLYPDLCIYFSEDKYLPPWWKRSSVVSLAVGGWLVILGMMPYLGFSVHHCHQHLDPQDSFSQANLHEWRFMLFCLCPASISATTATLSTGLLGKHSDGCRKKLTDIDRVHNFVYLLSSQSVSILSHLSTYFFPRLPHIHPADPLHSTSCMKQQSPFLLQCPSIALYW